MTPDRIRQLCPKCSPEWADAISAAMAAREINTPARSAMFLAQWAHETAGFTRFIENLNYADTGLVHTWPGCFKTLAFAALYHRKPEAIGNRAYADRMGNGNEMSGDGWRFRGRGPCMLTGRANYREAAIAVGWPLEGQPDDAALPVPGAAIAAWFWQSRGCNEYADRDDFASITRRINGGAIGAEDRRQWLARIQDFPTQPGTVNV